MHTNTQRHVWRTICSIVHNFCCIILKINLPYKESILTRKKKWWSPEILRNIVQSAWIKIVKARMGIQQVHAIAHVFISKFYSVQFSHLVVADTLQPIDCSTSGLHVHHQLLEFTQTHVHWVGDAIQPSHPLLSPSPPTFSLSQHQGLFKWVSSSN